MSGAELWVDGTSRGTVTDAALRAGIRSADEFIEVRAADRVMQAAAVPGGLQLWEQSEQDRRVGLESTSVVSENEAVAALLAFSVGSTPTDRPAMHVIPESPVSILQAALLPLFALAGIVAAALYAAATYDPEGTLDMAALGVGIVCWFGWMYFYLGHTIEFVRRRLQSSLDLDLRPRRSDFAGPLFWHVADRGRPGARLAVAGVSVLLILGLALPILIVLAAALFA